MSAGLAASTRSAMAICSKRFSAAPASFDPSRIIGFSSRWYAATEAADMFVFAAHDYAALGDDQVAVSVLHRGLTFVSSALADLQPPDKFRRQLVHSQQEMHDLLSGLE